MPYVLGLPLVGGQTTLMKMRWSHVCLYTTSPASPDEGAYSCFVTTEHVRHQPGPASISTPQPAQTDRIQNLLMQVKKALIIYSLDQQIHNILTIMSEL